MLEDKHVVLVPGSGFGEQGYGHFRIVFLPPEDVIEQAFDAMRDFISNS